MRSRLILLAFVLLGSVRTRGAETQSLYRDWTFNYFPATQPDLASIAVDFDDHAWPAIALPHTWQTFETTREPHPFIRSASERADPYWWNGWGVYRKRFVLPPEMRAREKQVFVEFDGVQKYARVFLNGHELGDHRGGYDGFSFELTTHLRANADNVLVVLVSNRRDDPFGGIPPMTAGNFNVYGGLYRDVRLVVKDRLHFPFQGSSAHEGGTFVTTPEVSRARAVVRIRTWVRNAYPVSQSARLETRILAPDGAVLQTLTRDLTVAAGELAEVDELAPPISQPRLWSPEAPQLYRVESRLELAGHVVDQHTSPLGFRWFRWDTATHRLILNDQPVVIHGTNRHQDYPWLGDAMPKWLHARDLDDIRHNLAHNFMRTAHYPQDDFAYDLNDRLGIITVAEVPNIKSIQFGRDIQEANARAMVRRLRNHPSIFFWSVGNETSQAADSRWIREEDDTRIIHARKAEQYGDYVTHTHEDLDLENLLRCTVRGWHDEDFADPTRVHPASGQITGTEEWQHEQARVPGASLRGVVNEQTVAWVYADHGCDRIYAQAPLKYVNPKGWVDAYREPKYMYYLWQANWLERPMVFVQPHHWRRKFIGQRKSIQVDSNAAEVELFAGATSLGTRPLSRETSHTVAFDDVLVRDATLRAVTRQGGRVVAEWEVPMAGAPARLTLTARHEALVADRASIAVLRVDVVDAAGQHAGGVTPPLAWTISGPGRLLTPNVYAPDTTKDRAAEGIWYTDLPISTLIRTTGEPGTIRVQVSSAGLAPAEIALESARDERTSSAGITEPPLGDAGRKPVSRLMEFIDPDRSREDIAPMRDSPHFGVRSTSGYRAALDQLVRARNPALAPQAPAYDRLLARLTAQLAASSGTLIEDDYNFLAARYNTCAQLYRTVDALGFHPRYRDAWKTYLADTLVGEGTGAPADELELLLRTVPREGRFVEVTFLAGPPHLEFDAAANVALARAADLPAALTLLHPADAAAPVGGRNAFEADVRRFNPWLIRSGVGTVPLWLPAFAKDDGQSQPKRPD